MADNQRVWIERELISKKQKIVIDLDDSTLIMTATGAKNLAEMLLWAVKCSEIGIETEIKEDKPNDQRP